MKVLHNPNPPAPASPDDMLREPDMSRWLNVSAFTLQGWRRNGGGPPFIKIGGGIRYRRGDVLAWLNARKVAK